MENQLSKPFEGYMNKLSKRFEEAERIARNIRNLKSLSDEQLRIKLLNGKLEERLQEEYKYGDRDSPPCTSLSHGIYRCYLTLRQKGEYPKIPFFEKLNKILSLAHSRIETTSEKCRDNFDRSFGLHEKYGDCGELSEHEVNELVRFEEDERNYQRARNNYIIVGDSLLGHECVRSFNGLSKIKKLPIVKFYERRLSEKEYRYFMGTPASEIIDNILSQWDVDNLDSEEDPVYLSFGLFEWGEVSSAIPYQKVMHELNAYKRDNH